MDVFFTATSTWVHAIEAFIISLHYKVMPLYCLVFVIYFLLQSLNLDKCLFLVLDLSWTGLVFKWILESHASPVMKDDNKSELADVAELGFWGWMENF